VPVPDPNLARRCAACVVLKKETVNAGPAGRLSEEKEIAKFKLPERLEIFDDLPVSTFGKVSKKRSVESVASRPAKIWLAAALNFPLESSLLAPPIISGAQNARFRLGAARRMAAGRARFFASFFGVTALCITD